ncbi:5-bromo-4-chloroindolyl phosphate hydrolysis family protein [Bacillus sp. ISL-47]|uniref:5-bromo-4-chloroindolyl phosphate hydrolysis family protein n=1 Tax=Bacillus sp. ISL-47 TaxID=2819130 RepID=UPI001BEAE856|nr:5-bromo-4-chloroindolyl phosphate hydrolysis family protein [Bacillus sp. ISL-47]MBT2688882.1 5-bromo-4-chloroindolyl phosphate hydrolysis family protein [Bacillus sp. ISL-47]MBT2709093.1 5-bromo-4-chloroindolyl phosphate hydrolysis family protein [Pseudomonas sp. ISL-84]
MNSFLAFAFRMLTAFPLSVSVWLVSYFAFDQTFLLSGVYGVGTGLLTYWAGGVIQRHRFLKKHGLTRREYQYIKRNLDEAKRKLTRLHKAMFSIRHFPTLKQRMEFMRVTRRIYRLTRKEPKRFYQAEQFYFSHLDSAVELAEKYVFLSSQPKKTRELNQSLEETRRTLDALTHHVEEDLHRVIEEDIDQLNFEIDVAKNSIEKIKDSRIQDESRRLK